MELLIDSVFMVCKLNLLSGFDRLVDDFDIEKQRLILRFVPVLNRMDVLYVGTKILIGKSA